jgi:hypothetical protein
MKNQVSNILLLLLIPIVIPITGCKKKCNELGTLSFNAKELNIIPYNGKQELKIYQDGLSPDTLQGIRVDVFNTITANSNSGIDNQGCSGDYYSVEYNRINFVSIVEASVISLDLEYDNPYTSKGINKYLNIAIGATYGPSELFINRMPLKNDSIVVNDSTVFYHNNLSVGSKQFTSVYELHPGTPANLEIQKVYYTLDLGIVAFLRQGIVFYVERL